MKKLLLYTISLLSVLTTFGQNLQISGGNTFSVSICSNSNVYAWGANGSGQVLGTSSSTSNFPTPQLVNGLPSNMRQVDAGSGSHVVGVDCNGRVWTWGLDNCGQTGRGGAVPAGAGCESGSNWRVTGTVPGIGIGQTYGAATYVSGGNNTSYAIMTNTGEVLAWGQNDQGQLADGGTTNRATPDYVLTAAGVRLRNIVQIEGGDNTSYALDRSGFVWSWGANGTGNKEAGRLPSGNLLFAGLVQADYNNDGTADGPLRNIIMLSGGDTHGLAIDVDGRVWAWGGNWAQGQLGNGSNYNDSYFAKMVNAPNNSSSTMDRGVGPFLGDPGQPRAIFIAASQAASAVVLNTGRVVTFGANYKYGGTGCNYGTVGQGSTANSGGTSGSLFPRYVLSGASTTLTGIVSVSDGDGWFFAQDASGQIYTWGENAGGTLGDGSTTCREYAVPISLPSGCTAVIPCASKPFLGTDFSACPSNILSTNQLGNSYRYVWQTRTGTTGGWNLVSSGSGVSFSTASGSTFGQYRLLIEDTRGSTSVLCGVCPTVGDTITISPPACTTTNPNLGSTLQVCQPVSQALNSGLTNPNLVYRWEYSTTSSTAGFNTISTGAGLGIFTATGLGFWRVTVIDNTTCSGCVPSSPSVVLLTTAPSVFNAGPSTICTTVANTGIFSITTTAGGGSYFWYSNPSGGTALSTTPGLTISGISVGQTSTLAGCTGRVLYVQDQSSVQGALLPGATLAAAPCGGAGNRENYNGGTAANISNGTPMMIRVNNNLSLSSVSIIQDSYGYNYTGNYTVEIFANQPTGGPYCSGCSPAGNYDGPTGSPICTSAVQSFTQLNGDPARVRTLTIGGCSLTPGFYWIAVSGGELRWFNCSTPAKGTNGRWSTAVNDNTGSNYLQAVSSIRQNQNQNSDGRSHVFNLTFSAGNVSACTRVPVCAGVNCPLNVTYANFTGTKINEGVLLRWTTLSESNSSHFVIEKSTDGVSFVAIGKVIAKGNSNGWLDYSFLDKSYNKGTVYYRLVQFDLDNSYYVSNTVAVNVTPLSDFQIVPNPNNGTFAVKASFNSATLFEIKINDAVGHLIYANVEDGAGDFNKEFNLNSLAPGVYFISLKADETYLVKKIIVE